MLNEALLKACARSFTFCSHTPFTAPSCCFSMADDAQKGFFPWARTGGQRAENAQGKAEGSLLMLQGDLR